MSQTRDTLRQLDKEALIETVVLLRARVATLEKRVAELEGKARPAAVEKTAQNWSAPSSRSWKPKPVKAIPAKRGPKVGHVGKGRPPAAPDEVLACRVEICPACGQDLTGVDQALIDSRQRVDLPPIRPVVREAQRYGVTCPCCGQYQVGAYPADFETGRVLGPHLEALVVYLHHAQPLSYQRVQHISRSFISSGLMHATNRNGLT